jgi:hypothetical protein
MPDACGGLTFNTVAPSWLADGGTRPAAALERERERHEGATMEAQGGLVASAGANEGGGTVPRGEGKASRHSLPSDLRQAQDKEAGGARLSCLCCGGSDGIRTIAKHTRVTVCSSASIVSPSCERRPCRDFCARAGSVGRLAGAASSSTRRVGLLSARAEVSPRLGGGKARRVRSARLLLVDWPAAFRAPGEHGSEKAAPRALVEERQGGQEARAGSAGRKRRQEAQAWECQASAPQKVSMQQVVCRH